MALAGFLNTGKLTSNIIVIQVVRKLQCNFFIIGNQSGLALLDISENPHHEKDIREGGSLKLIKPLFIDNQTIQTNKSFKPIPSKETFKLSPSKEDIAKFQIKTENVNQKNNLITIESILANKSQTIIPSLTVMITNVSRIIETKTGKYQICEILDTESKKISLNLYDSFIGKLEFGKIYTIAKVKKTVIKKNDENEVRLLTTKFTKMSEASEEDQLNFENVKFAEKIIQGIIIGLSDINSYQHWNKLDEDDICPKCGGRAPKVKTDFNTDLYIQDSVSDEIHSFLIFKRQVKTIISEEDHEAIINKFAELEGKECIVEFDEPTEEEPIIPKRLKLG